jgi:myo-inositol-1-phosphate synthase
MKLYMAIVDTVGNCHTSVLKTNTPIEMLKHIFVSGTTGMFDLKAPAIEPRVFEVNQFWVDHSLVDLDVNEVIAKLSGMLSVCDDDEAEEAVLEMMGDGLTEDPQSFLTTLRKLFNGEEEDLSEMTEEQTLLLAVISL